jgi:triphosphoribosyl-dephospho-CoA synthase
MGCSRSLAFQIACIWEATARKPGNVHRFADFDDCSYADFLLSAAAAAPVWDRAPQEGVGATVLAAIEATRRVSRTNTNLGICLMIAPLACVPDGVPLRTGVRIVLDATTLRDSQRVFQAIRRAQPSGLGSARDQDVANEPTESLRDIMCLAAERDRVARHYAEGYHDLFEDLLATLLREPSLEAAIIRAHLELIARGDTLIARKCGQGLADEAAQRASQVLAKGVPGDALAEFDAWLRADGHRRNPGTSADIIAAGLFVLLREGRLEPGSISW